MSLLRSSAVVATFTLISRVFGFLRDIIIANYMGAGMLTDAFFAAFRIPNILRRLFAEGAFTAAFLPMFAGMVKVEGKDYALRFAASAMGILTAVLLVITTIAMIWMPEFLRLITPGFTDKPELFALTVDLTRITFPYLVLISLVSLLGGILNSYDRFAAVAFAPVLLNFGLILSLVVLQPPIVPTHAHALAIGVQVAGLMQLGWLVYANHRYGTLPKIAMPRMTPDVKKMLLAFAPVAFGAGVGQVNQLMDTIFATYVENAVSYLYYADRLYELPLGVIGIAVATALLPMLSRHIRAGEMEEARIAIEQALRFVALIGLPAAVALIVIAHPIVATIYEHGEFDTADSAKVIPALIAFSCGLPAFLMVKIFVNCFFAATDTRTPVKIAVLCVSINFVLNCLLIGPYEHVGLAASTSFAAWVNAALLGYFLYKRNIFRPSRPFMQFLGKLMLVLVVMAAVLLGAHSLIAEWFTQGLHWRGLGIILLIGAGMGTYFTGIIAVKAISLNEMKSWTQKTSTPAIDMQ
jgi:putative peptidoglycan lipid II flippase